MLIEFSRIREGLCPVTDEGAEAINKIALHDRVFMEYKPKRNYKFHKKYWSLLNAVFPNQKHFKTVDNLHEAVKYRAGYYETIIPLKGEPFIKTKSIAFHSMDEHQFEMFYSNALDVCVELTDERAVQEIIRFM